MALSRDSYSLPNLRDVFEGGGYEKKLKKNKLFAEINYE
jgi:hypothetical protein